MDKDDISRGCEIAFEVQNVISEQDDMILEEVPLYFLPSPDTWQESRLVVSSVDILEIHIQDCLLTCIVHYLLLQPTRKSEAPRVETEAERTALPWLHIANCAAELIVSH